MSYVAHGFNTEEKIFLELEIEKICSKLKVKYCLATTRA